jgi:chaperonin GroEL
MLCANAGLEGAVEVNAVAAGTGNFGYNVATGIFEDLVQSGVVDPTKVTRAALQNAASIAGLLLTTECMITELPAAGSSRGPGDATDGS